MYVIEIEIQVPLAQSIASSPVSIGSVAVLAFVVVIAIILWVALKKKKIPEDIPNASKKLYNVIIIIKFIYPKKTLWQLFVSRNRKNNG